MNYDETNPISIELYAQKLIGKTFADVCNEDDMSKAMVVRETSNYEVSHENKNRKGGLGEIIEERFFHYRCNNDSRPDFDKAGVELKVTPYKINKNGSIAAKERLIITMIDYFSVVEEKFEDSHMWNKARLILLIYYLYQQDIRSRLDYKIGYAKLFSPPETDIKIIKNDFEIIVEKIKSGKAHELSEGDTMYLGAAPKAATSKDRRKQPFSSELAKPRAFALQYPTASEYDWQNNAYLQKLYITSGEKRNQYIYSQYSDFNDVTIDFGNDKVAFKNSKRAKIKGNSDEVAIYEMSEKESGLPAILRYPGMKAHFEEMGYALKFEMNEYLLSPVLFHNIYKGALGEVAGKFILSRELGIELLPITEPEYFEFFDYKLSDDVYVDFKNWKFTYVQDRDEIRKDILRKLDAMMGKRVYIINVVSDKNYKPSAIVDQRLVEIPMLIKEDGTVCYENLHMIRKEDFENVN